MPNRTGPSAPGPDPERKSQTREFAESINPWLTRPSLAKGLGTKLVVALVDPLFADPQAAKI